jgi:hypothetical protein
MRKLIISAIATAALIAIACETAASTLLSAPQFASTAPSVSMSVHASHGGSPRHGHATLFMCGAHGRYCASPTELSMRWGGGRLRGAKARSRGELDAGWQRAL